MATPTSTSNHASSINRFASVEALPSLSAALKSLTISLNAFLGNNSLIRSASGSHSMIIAGNL
jgi:hypothetical protein